MNNKAFPHKLARCAVTLVLGMCLMLPGAVEAQCQQSNSGSEVVGTLLGAAVGGLLGSNFGSGTGNKIAIGAGVLAGGLLGNNIGKSMDCQDREYHGEAAQGAFETQPSGTTTSWRNPDSGHAGTVTPVRTYQRADGTYCRDFDQSITIDGHIEQATGTACRQTDGTWRIVG